VKSAPPTNGVPVETAVSVSPKSHSDAQSEMPGMIVLSVGEGTQASAAGAGADGAAAERAMPACFGTSRSAARTGSGRSCRLATVRPSRSPLARATAAWRPRSRRPMRDLMCREGFSSIAAHCCGCFSSVT
jgi:hypothetical protein